MSKIDKNIIEKAVKQALDVRENAYAPYSKFKVGATIITKKGNIYKGVNVENSSFGATVCAERIALFTAVSNGEKEIEAVVIASNLNGEAVYPCGICRQVLSDFNPEMNVIMVNSDSKKIEKEIKLNKIFESAFKF